MARANKKLIDALRITADKLEKGAPYQWGHMGSCNCGNLAQELTRFDKKEIHAYAMRRKGDWSEQAEDYCPESGYPMDVLISELMLNGLQLEDLRNLERLSDRDVLRTLPNYGMFLRHNNRDDVVLYMRAWANLLEGQIPAPKPETTSITVEEIIGEEELIEA